MRKSLLYAMIVAIIIISLFGLLISGIRAV